jgi:transposase
MKHLTSEMKRQQLEWRRAKVLELSSHGYSEREIAERLAPLAACTVHRDLIYVRKQAQSNLQHHIHEVIPMELERCMVGIKGNLK